VISLTRLTGQPFVVNADLLLFVEATPDTMLTFTNGTQICVRDTVDEVVKRVLAYRWRVQAGPVAGMTPAVVARKDAD
jgi:flagellar protein FlbD